MHLYNNSINVVLVGDWNRLYIQPDWITTEIFEDTEIEIGVEGQGSDFRISYKKDKIAIKPTQRRVTFLCDDIETDTLEMLARCVNNYLHKAHTPELFAYGFNAKYFDLEDMRLADVFDRVPDRDAFLNLGYEIRTSEISRSLVKDGKTIKVKCSMNQGETEIHFNEHHEKPKKDFAEISGDQLTEFIKDCNAILEELGYEIEDGAE